MTSSLDAEAGRILREIDPRYHRDGAATPVHALALDGDVEPLGATWTPHGVASTVDALLAGTLHVPEPTILSRTDGRHVFYAGKVNGIAGTSGDGKSWVALLAASEQLTAGQSVVYLDLEDDEASVVGRLLALGTDPGAIRSGFHYASPHEAYSNDAREALEAFILAVAPSLVVVDSTGEALALDGSKPNDDDDVARWFRRLPGSLARLGPTVVVVDHVPHNAEDQNRPIGSQRKRAAITGHQVMTKLAKPFSKNQPGMVKLISSKDRHGNYRRGETVAEVTVTPGDDGSTLALEVAAPASGDGDNFRPTHYMERVSRHLEEAAGPLTRNEVSTEVKGNKQHLVTALKVLVAEGYVQREQVGQAHLHRSVRFYRESMG